jgi:hypothetical protein
MLQIFSAKDLRLSGTVKFISQKRQSTTTNQRA